MNFHIVTLFPEAFDSYLNESIIGRAIKEKKIKVTFVNPRDFVTGKYKKVWPDGNVSRVVDDRPYGGGPGMIIRAEPMLKAVESIVKKIEKRNAKINTKIKVVNFLPAGKKFTTLIFVFIFAFLFSIFFTIDSTALSIGSARIIIPGPPPYGRSSTTRETLPSGQTFLYLPVTKSRGFTNVTLIFFSLIARPIIDSLRYESNASGNNVTIWKFILLV